MTISKTALWTISVIAAAAIGWLSAMEVSRGPALRDEEDAYERFSNAFTITDSMDRIELVARLVRRLAPQTLPGAVRAIYDDQKDIYNNDFRMLLWYWARQDPRGMLKDRSIRRRRGSRRRSHRRPEEGRRWRYRNVQGWPGARSPDLERIVSGFAVLVRESLLAGKGSWVPWRAPRR